MRAVGAAANGYILSDDVALDWRRVEQLIAEPKKADDADEAAFLYAASRWPRARRGRCSSGPLRVASARADDLHPHRDDNRPCRSPTRRVGVGHQ